MSLKREIVEALTGDQGLMLSEICDKLGKDRDMVAPDVKGLVRAGTLRMKEDPVEHDWTYSVNALARAEE